MIISSLDILNIDCKLLKLAAECIASTLTHSFNISLQCVIAPSYWKYSRVTPIYKGAGDVKDCSNFRHISVIGHIAKMLEKEVQCQLMSYLIEHDFISVEQYGIENFILHLHISILL